MKNRENDKTFLYSYTTQLFIIYYLFIRLSGDFQDLRGIIFCPKYPAMTTATSYKVELSMLLLCPSLRIFVFCLFALPRQLWHVKGNIGRAIWSTECLSQQPKLILRWSINSTVTCFRLIILFLNAKWDYGIGTICMVLMKVNKREFRYKCRKSFHVKYNYYYEIRKKMI